MMSIRTVAVTLALSAGFLLGGCNNDFQTTTIANGGIVVHGGEVTLRGTGGHEASVDETGKLSVDGHEVAVDAAQRKLLQQYYQGALAVREHGLATGRAGARVAVQSLKNAATKVTGGDSEQADAGLDAATQRVNREASKICLDIQQIRLAQDRLADALPAFKPFAGIIDDDGSDCSTDA
jgi:hypothetical protein